MFYCRCFFLFQREIFEMGQLIGVKFCMVIIPRPNFIMPLQNFRSPPQKNFRVQKHANFGPILDDFKV